jgi:hypothetical protein
MRTTFGGINSDIPPGRTASGTADTALNVVLEQGILAKRMGFGVYEDAVASTSSVLNMTVVTFADGDAYVVVKLADKSLYYRKLTGTPDTVFTAITGGWTHNATDAGFFFFWKNFLHYSDRAGVSRWDPDKNSAAAVKAGVPRPSVTLTVASNTAGPPWYKRGLYKATYTYKNSVTEEEGVAAVLSAELLVGSGVDANTYVQPSNWATVQATADKTGYDAGLTDCVFYCTNGSGINLIRAYREHQQLVSRTAGFNLWRADSQHNPSDVFANAGGEPNGAQVGCMTARNQAIYGNVWVSAALVPGRLDFSVPGLPCSVPSLLNLSAVAGELDYYEPSPFRGQNPNAIAGNIVAMGYGGGRAFCFTPSKTYSLLDGGYITPILIDQGHGADGEKAVTGTKDSLHVINGASWNRVYGGVQDIARNRFATTLNTVPATYRSLTVMGYYSHKNQVWAAVTKAGGTVPKRILVLDLDQDALTMFDHANLQTAESITCMVECAYSGASPTMLIGTSRGAIYQYPAAVATDADYTGSATGYSAQWRGYFAQERIFADQQIKGVAVHCGENCATNVTIGLRPMKESGAGETVTQQPFTLTKTSKVEEIGFDFTRVDGSFFQIDISSASAVTSQWKIRDLALRLKRTDK